MVAVLLAANEFEAIATTENLELRAQQAIRGRFISLARTHLVALPLCVFNKLRSVS